MRNFFWLIIFTGNISYAQTVIEGLISNDKYDVVSNSTILILKKSTDSIIAYSISDAKGFYSVSFFAAFPDIDLQIRSMGYKVINESLNNRSQTKNFTLEDQAFQLKEIVVKSTPIVQKGDTIKYSVNSFSKEKDRSIGDVLKRMPGIEVLTDGKVLYQGRPINKFYIEGLDLLEGKYNLANENLPYKEVTQVQIIENHQPIKALDSIKFSDQAALNIKLRNKYTYTGQARLGLGVIPLLWDTNITPMLFTKKKQMLVTYQSNNTGENVSLQLKKLTIEDLISQFQNNSEKSDWLSIQQLTNPKFAEKRWLDNHIHLLSGNYLQKLKNDFEIRVNLSYLNDYQRQEGFTNTKFITPGNTITILEEKYNQLFFNSLQTNVTLQKNAKKNYFKNNLEFQGFWDSQRGTILLNTENLEQQLSNEFFKLSNNSKLIFAIGKQMLTINSYFVVNRTPQTLKVTPGRFEDLLNNNLPYDKVEQQIDLKSLSTHNFISFIKTYKRFSFEPKVGFQIENQILSSEIYTSENANLGNDFSNNLDWFRTKIYFDAPTQYKNDRWRIEVTAPVNYHSYKISDSSLFNSENLNKVTFEPRLLIVYDLNSFWKINTSAGVSNSFGTINQLHYAYILQNYRSLQRINTPLPQNFSRNYSVGLTYKNPIKALFCNIAYVNMLSSNNLLYKSKILDNGASELQAVEQDNNRYSHNISSRASKYFSAIKSNITISSTYGLQKFQQIVNNTLTKLSNSTSTVGCKFETDFTDYFNVEYQGNWTFYRNVIQDQVNPSISEQNHNLNINIYPKENQYFAIKSELIYNNLFSEKSETIFADIIYRYTIKTKSIDLEVQLSNIFNSENYRTLNITDFNFVDTNYTLRPRQILFKIRFTL